MNNRVVTFLSNWRLMLRDALANRLSLKSGLLGTDGLGLPRTSWTPPKDQTPRSRSKYMPHDGAKQAAKGAHRRAIGRNQGVQP